MGSRGSDDLAMTRKKRRMELIILRMTTRLGRRSGPEAGCQTRGNRILDHPTRSRDRAKRCSAIEFGRIISADAADTGRWQRSRWDLTVLGNSKRRYKRRRTSARRVSVHRPRRLRMYDKTTVTITQKAESGYSRMDCRPIGKDYSR